MYNKTKPEELIAKSQEDVDRRIESILEKKNELISFNTSLAFIFSHSALREGRDNPNVFILCTLKSGGSDIAKKQEIGRGLRLPVDVRGMRFSDPAFAELTVIADDRYEHFANVLQKDFNDQNGFHKDIVTEDLLQTVLVNAGVPEAKITAELVCALRDDLIAAKVVKLDKNKECRLAGTPDANSRLLAEWPMDSDATLAEHAVKIKECFIAAMREKGSHKIEVINRDLLERKNGFQSYISEAPFKDLFTIINEILHHTALPRLAIYKIIDHLPDSEWLSDQDALDGAVRLIKKRLADAKSNGVVKFETIGDYHLDNNDISRWRPPGRSCSHTRNGYFSPMSMRGAQCTDGTGPTATVNTGLRKPLRMTNGFGFSPNFVRAA